MFQNNNGAVVKHLAKSSLKANRRRNIFIVLTIAVSSCLMATMVLLAMGFKQEKINDIDGQFQASLLNVSDSTLDALKCDPDLEGAGEYCSIGKKDFSGYTLNSIYMDKDTLKLSKSSWEGALPKEQNEVMLEKAYLTEVGKSIGIGGTVLLDLGDGEKEYRVTGFFQYKSKSTDASNYSVICSNAYLKSRLSTDEISKIVYIRIANSSGMSSQALENAIFNVAERHGISPSNVATSALYFNAIKPIDASSLLITIGVAVMVAFASALVIYSIFYISVTGKVREYGQLRTIGTTQKQIKKIVFWEGCHLSATGIPLGILVSCVIAFLAVPKGWNSATTLGVCLAVAIITFIVVIFAIRRPMKIAAGTSPVEAIRYSAASDSTKAIKTKKLHRKITPIRLALMNFSRNRKKSILTLISLGFSGILLMCAASFSNSVPIEGMARGDLFTYGQFHLSLSYENSDNSDGYAVSRIQQNNPLDEALKQRILSIDGVTGIQTEELTKVHYSAPNGSREEAWVSGFLESEANSFNSSLKSGTCDYDTCRKQNGIIAAVASTFKKVYGQEPAVGDKINLEFYTAKGIVKKEFTVLGVTDNRFKDKDGDFLIPEENLHDIMGTDCTGQFAIAVDSGEKSNVESALRSITASNSSLELETLDSIIAETRSQMQTFFAVVYTIVLVIAFFGIINLVNTIVTNILARKQEIGVLQAIGLSNKQLNQMLQIEGLLYTLGTIAATLTVGTGLGWLLCETLRRYAKAAYMEYRFPILQVSVFIAVFLIIQIAISYFSSSRLKKQSLIDRMRETE